MVAMSLLLREVLTGVYNFCFPRGYTEKENGIVKDVPYFLRDEKYPNWPIFVIPIPHSKSYEKEYYRKRQEATMKDKEWCFGVLQARLRVLCGKSCRCKDNIVRISKKSVIFHNMLIGMQDSGLVASEVVSGNFNIVTQFYIEEKAAEAANQGESFEL